MDTFIFRALFLSFETVPSVVPIHSKWSCSTLITQGSDIFSLGLKIGLPVVCVVLLVNVGLATLRTVPQINIFVIGFLITITVGLLILGLAIPTTGDLFARLLEDTLRNAVTMLRYF